MEAAYTHGIVSAARTNWTTLAQMQADYYWSTVADTPTGAWIVYLAYGLANGNGKTWSYQVACVK